MSDLSCQRQVVFIIRFLAAVECVILLTGTERRLFPWYFPCYTSWPLKASAAPSVISSSDEGQMEGKHVWWTIGAAWVIAAVPVVTFMLSAPGAWAASHYKSLHHFNDGRSDCEGPNKGGCYSRSTLVFDAAGNLYGTTSGGGSWGLGTVFKLTLASDGHWKETVLHSFRNDGKDGTTPLADLTFDLAGNPYGTTLYGGAYGGSLCCGTVFKLSPNRDGTWTESVLHSFGANDKDGFISEAGVIRDAQGNLYGTTEGGGLLGWGTVFELTLKEDGHWSERVLYWFRGDSDGRQPHSGLIFDGAGNLYGTTSGGGAFREGTVYKLSQNHSGFWTESVLHSFDGEDGNDVEAGLICDAAGNLYGTTAYGGAYFWGTVFKLAPTAKYRWKESVLYAFSFDDARNPVASLVLDAAGNLYGTTADGTGFGTVFELRPTSHGRWSKRVLHTFKNHPGALPFGSLIFDAKGNLYGTTEGDPYYHTFGSVFEITP